MSYRQLKQPDLSVKGISGFCLNYARRVFGVGAKYPNAWKAWENTKYKHKDRKLPNVSVPVWFSYKRGGVNLGHVAVNVPGRGLYTSPIGGKSFYRSLADFEHAVSNCKYVGWSEDINGVRVAAPVAKPKPPVKKSNEQIAKEVIAGKWGNGPERKTRLKKAGYDYNKIQAIVNKKVR